jgi:hypothetical protein
MAPAASVWRLRATGSAPRGIDAAEVRRAVKALADPRQGFHVQGIPVGGSAVLKGDDEAGAVAAAGRIDGGTFTYFTLNPVPAGLKLGRGRAVRVGDVTERRWLLVDVDPPRPKAQNASDEEHAAALKTSADVRASLLGEHLWPDPCVVDSGNGYHLLFPLDLPNTLHARALVAATLRRLVELYPAAGIDPDNAAANAKTKLPGTWVRKFSEDDDRPHRMARLVVEGQWRRPLTAQQLAAFTGLAAEPPAEPPKKAGDPFKLKSPPSKREAAYLAAALDRECATVAGLTEPGRQTGLNTSAFRLGRLLPAGLDRAEAERRLSDAARDCGLDRDDKVGDRGIRDVIRRGLDAGSGVPREIPEPSRNGAHKNNAAGEREAPAAEPGEDIWTVGISGEIVAEGKPQELADQYRVRPKGGRKFFEVLTLNEIMAREIPEPNWAVPGLLAEGLNLLAGAPKQGKSMMALNLAMTVAGGGKALGSIQVQPGDVLYLSLEDRLRRVQFRARKMAAKIPGAGQRLSVVTEWPMMDQGGLGLLSEWVKRVERPTLVIIDVLQKFRPRTREKGSMYEQDSEHLYAIKRFADDNGVTALVNHHTRKMKDDDPLATVSGTFGITGACDGYAVLDRVRGSNEATVFFEGRDAGNQKLAVQFDPETLTWSSLGSAEEHLQGRLQKAVIDYLKDLGTPAFVDQIAGGVKSDDGSVRKTLHRLNEKGLVRRHGAMWGYPGGVAAAPPDEESF